MVCKMNGYELVDDEKIALTESMGVKSYDEDGISNSYHVRARSGAKSNLNCHSTRVRYLVKKRQHEHNHDVDL